MSHWTRQLTALRACAEAITWAKGYDSLDAAWHACERADWMLWLAGHCAGDVDSASRQRVVLAACACARTALKHTKDPRPLKAIETAEAWARGEAGVTLDDVRNARVAAAAAAYAADAAADAAAAAFAAAYAAAYAAAVAAAAAAYAAAYAADAAADADADALRKMADIVRQHIPEPPAPRATR